MNGIYDITDYGAIGDGRTDCTLSIQKAIDKAGKEPGGAAVLIPPGVYLASTIHMLPHVHVCGYHSWSIRHNGCSVIKLNDDIADCLIDITGAIGCVIAGICLEGDNLGKKSHGILYYSDLINKEEDTFTLEDCHISNFSGDGMHIHYACCFSVRHSQIFNNAGDGIYLNGWDGFLLDNMFSGNKGWGIRCASDGFNNAAMTVTGNRVEWNRKGGFLLQNAKLWSITGNYFDRSGGPAIHIAEGLTPEQQGDSRWVKLPCNSLTITGNIFNRSGADFDKNMEEMNKAHIRMHECYNVTVVGNTMQVGMDDGVMQGQASPKYGIIVDRLKGCVISSNVLYNGAVDMGIKDLEGHSDQVFIEKNAINVML